MSKRKSAQKYLAHAERRNLRTYIQIYFRMYRKSERPKVRYSHNGTLGAYPKIDETFLTQSNKGTVPMVLKTYLITFVPFMGIYGTLAKCQQFLQINF